MKYWPYIAALVLIVIIAVIVLLIAREREVEGNTLSWTAPVVRADGTPYDIVAEGGYYYMIVVAPVEGGPELGYGDTKLDATATSMDLTPYVNGTSFAVRSCDRDVNCSPPSAMVMKGPGTFPGPRPDQPTGVKVWQ